MVFSAYFEKMTFFLHSFLVYHIFRIKLRIVTNTFSFHVFFYLIKVMHEIKIRPTEAHSEPLK